MNIFFRYDCIAIADFQMGAMENWGLVTFRETAVLVDPKNTSAKTKQWVNIYYHCVPRSSKWF